MSIIPFRPFMKLKDDKLIEIFWNKLDRFNKISISDNGYGFEKKEINEIIKEIKKRELKISKEDLIFKILN